MIDGQIAKLREIVRIDPKAELKFSYDNGTVGGVVGIPALPLLLEIDGWTDEKIASTALTVAP